MTNKFDDVIDKSHYQIEGISIYNGCTASSTITITYFACARHTFGVKTFEAGTDKTLFKFKKKK